MLMTSDSCFSYEIRTMDWNEHWQQIARGIDERWITCWINALTTFRNRNENRWIENGFICNVSHSIKITEESLMTPHTLNCSLKTSKTLIVLGEIVRSIFHVEFPKLKVQIWLLFSYHCLRWTISSDRSK